MSQATESFPRQRARTRGFRLGAPRSFGIRHRPDGSVRTTFLRSAGGRIASGDLWVIDNLDATRERCVVEATAVGESGEVPAAELARRERLREVTAGITAYSLDHAGTFAAFALDGVPYRVNLDDGHLEPLVHASPVIDPRISPDGTLVAFVSDGRVYLADPQAGTSRCLTPHEAPHVTWGLADFIAAEELERHRGLWWLPDSGSLLVERVDESIIDVCWIGDPAQPELEPTPHRYPSAGSTNANVSVHLVGLDGVVTDLDWDTEQYCYLASVHIPRNQRPIVTVLSRDQQEQRIFRVDVDSLTELATRRQEPWITVIPGVPTLDPAGSLIEVCDVEGTYRLMRDGAPISPEGVNIEAVVDVTEDSIVVQAAEDPCSRVVMEIASDGSSRIISSEDEWTAAIADAGVRVEVAASLTQTGSRASIVSGEARSFIASLAESPSIHPKPRVVTVGPRELRSAVLLPQQHEPGMTWPVICSPYGGPHAQRVINAAQAYLTEQWLADQGFAVVITDGRGTPGRGPQWEYDVFHDLADPVLDDQVEALQAVGELEPALDLTRVGIRGWSFGGYLAALAVLDRPDVFHAAVAGAPVTDWRLYDTAYTERYLGNPNDDDAPYRHTSLIEKADQLTRPLLLIHGLADDNVLAAHTLQMSSALLAAGKSHNVLPLSGVTHMTPQEIVAENLLLTEVEFFSRNLGR